MNLLTGETIEQSEWYNLTPRRTFLRYQFNWVSLFFENENWKFVFFPQSNCINWTKTENCRGGCYHFFECEAWKIYSWWLLLVWSLLPAPILRVTDFKKCLGKYSKELSEKKKKRIIVVVLYDFSVGHRGSSLFMKGWHFTFVIKRHVGKYFWNNFTF